ncbi:MAG: chemotaxis protein CheA [marine bacterium B5-7]|nr:MAG: chemotaxis protein CheA [marine bacterium B5-7]
MAIDLNDEIMQDFLLEAGEILELLNGQLLELESSPDNNDLLNAVFRGFHTIKGGAGFLAIEPLVEVCHTAENVFDLLRQGQRSVDAALMDVVLEVLDVVNDMFQKINQGQDPSPVESHLIERLKLLSIPEAEDSSSQAGVEPAPAGISTELHSTETVIELTEPTGAEATQVNSTSSAIEEITDAEFEDLLDQLHGKGAHGGVPVTEPAFASESEKETIGNTDTGSKEITDDEFETLLDELQANKQGAFKKTTEKPALETPAVATPQLTPMIADVNETTEKPVATKVTTPTAETTVRVETSTLDKIMNMVGELVLVRNRLTTLEAEIGDDDMSKTVNNLDVVTADLQRSVMKTRMQPIKKVFGRFPRVVRDLSRSLKKDVVLEMIGEETDLDKNLVEALADPLIHLVRNSVDHGIEMPDVREAAGKPRQGTVVLSAQQEGEHILLTIADDGAGIDAVGLRKNVIEKGLMDEDAISRLDEKEIYNLIFLPGFSIKKEISDISGRGVGMDVVKTRINQLNGIIDIDSNPGAGTTITIKVPLTLAIMPTLMIKLGEEQQTFALPLVNVNEIIELDMSKVNMVDGRQVVIIRGKPIPLFCLSNWLTNNTEGYASSTAHVVVVTIGTHHVGLLVDKLLGREEVVIKPLGALLQGTKGLAGATITSNGNIALIIDLPGLIQAKANNRH